MPRIKNFIREHKTEIVLTAAVAATVVVTAHLTAKQSSLELRNRIREVPIRVELTDGFFEEVERILPSLKTD